MELELREQTNGLKTVFASLEEACRRQRADAMKQQQEQRTAEAVLYIEKVLLPFVCAARTEGLWCVHLHDATCRGANVATCPFFDLAHADTKSAASAPSPVDCTLSASGGVLRPPSVADLIPLLLDIVPPGWRVRMTDACHVQLQCLVAVGDLIPCRWTLFSSASSAVAHDLSVLCTVVEVYEPTGEQQLKVRWPWHTEQQVTFHAPTGKAWCVSPVLPLPCTLVATTTSSPSSSSSPAASAVVVPPQDLPDEHFLALLPRPETSMYNAQTFFAAVLGMAINIPQRADRQRVLERALLGRPFLVRDKNGDPYPAVIANITSHTDFRFDVMLNFTFPSYSSHGDVFLPATASANDILAALPHDRTGLSQFFQAHLTTAAEVCTIRNDQWHSKELESVEMDASSSSSCMRLADGSLCLLDGDWVAKWNGSKVVNGVFYPMVFGMCKYAMQALIEQDKLYLGHF